MFVCYFLIFWLSLAFHQDEDRRGYGIRRHPAIQRFAPITNEYHRAENSHSPRRQAETCCTVVALNRLVLVDQTKQTSGFAWLMDDLPYHLLAVYIVFTSRHVRRSGLRVVASVGWTRVPLYLETDLAMILKLCIGFEIWQLSRIGITFLSLSMVTAGAFVLNHTAATRRVVQAITIK